MSESGSEKQPRPKVKVEDMALREGRSRRGKRRPEFDRALVQEDRPGEPTERRPGTYVTK